MLAISTVKNLALIFIFPESQKRVNYAYNKFNSPDGPIMVANYALTAWLAASGLDRARHNPLLPLVMGIKLVLDGVTNSS